MIRTIPLDKLVPSERNVRRRSDPQADLELKADIAARGLLQNLVVTSVRKPRGRYAVEAGERRRRALQGLAEDGALPRDFAVPCLVVDDVSDGREASLAENFQRLAMSPSDECLAFQQLIEHGSDVETVARRFGLTTRLCLALLAKSLSARLFPARQARGMRDLVSLGAVACLRLQPGRHELPDRPGALQQAERDERSYHRRLESDPVGALQ